MYHISIVAEIIIPIEDNTIPKELKMIILEYKI